MPHIRVLPNVDQTGGMPELQGREPVTIQTLTVTSLEHGMQSGAPSVAFVFDLPDGRYVFAETSLALFLTAADTLRTVHGDPRTMTGGGSPPPAPTN
jgi:hypothetical protein